MEVRGLNVTTSAAAKEKRLQALLLGREAAAAAAAEAVEAAQIVGSLELAGIRATAADVGEARQGRGPEPVQRLLRARRAVAAGTPFTVSLLRGWHEALVAAPSRFRTGESASPGAAPPVFVESRLQILEQWLRAESRRQLKPAQAGALVLARLHEIVPFDEANGRVARLAASHLMVEGGARPPLLVGADRDQLNAALQAAFQLVTEPLSAILDVASERALDVMIQALS